MKSSTFGLGLREMDCQSSGKFRKFKENHVLKSQFSYTEVLVVMCTFYQTNIYIFFYVMGTFLKELCQEIYQNSNSRNHHRIGSTIKTTAQNIKTRYKSQGKYTRRHRWKKFTETQLLFGLWLWGLILVSLKVFQSLLSLFVTFDTTLERHICCRRSCSVLLVLIDRRLRSIMKKPNDKWLINLVCSVITRKSQTSALIARSIHQGLSLRFPCNDLTLG